MERVIIGVDPHKLSATIEVVDDHERKLGESRFTTDKAGFAAMRAYAKTWPARVWAVEGAGGVGRPLAQRLLEAGEAVVDVPAKLAARARLLDTGHGRKTDAHDAHSVAVAAVRAKDLRVLAVDPQLEVLRMLVERHEALTRRRVQTVDRPQALLAELLPGQAKRDITTGQAKRMLASVRPRDLAGRTRRRIAAEGAALLEYIAAHQVVYLIELVCFVRLAIPALVVFGAVAVALKDENKSIADIGGPFGVARWSLGSRWSSSGPPARERGVDSAAPNTPGAVAVLSPLSTMS